MKLTDFGAVILDIDGTLFHEDEVLPGAAALTQYLAERGVKVGSLSNKSWLRAADLSTRFAELGLIIPANHIYTAGQAMAEWIVERWSKPRVYLLAPRAVREDLGSRVTLVGNADEPCDVIALADPNRGDEKPLSPAQISTALAHLRRNTELAVSCADRVIPMRGGMFEFGSGSWAAMFSYAANLSPQRVHFMGKPEPAFFACICRRLGIAPERCLMVGDNLESDIIGAQAVGLKTALVLTGVAERDHLPHHHIKPDFVFDDLVAMMAQMRD